MNYNNTNDVLDLAQRIYMRRPDLKNMSTDTLLTQIQKIADQDMWQPGMDILGIDNISKARALRRLLGEPDLSGYTPMTNSLGIQMEQDFNDYYYNPEDGDLPNFDPNKYFYAYETVNSPLMPISSLFYNTELSDDAYPIKTTTIRPHLNTALGKWYLNNGGKI